AGRAVRRAGNQVLHGLHYELPYRAWLPQVVTVHDLTMVTHPEWHQPAKVRYFGWAMRRAVHAAARGVWRPAPTARDLAERLGGAPDRVDVTPLGTDLAPASEGEIADLRARLGLDGPFLGGLGTLEPRKDLPTLVRAFATLARDLPHHLVLAGLPGWGAGELAAAGGASGPAQRVPPPRSGPRTPH